MSFSSSSSAADVFCFLGLVIHRTGSVIRSLYTGRTGLTGSVIRGLYTGRTGFLFSFRVSSSSSDLTDPVSPESERRDPSPHVQEESLALCRLSCEICSSLLHSLTTSSQALTNCGSGVSQLTRSASDLSIL